MDTQTRQRIAAVKTYRVAVILEIASDNPDDVIDVAMTELREPDVDPVGFVVVATQPESIVLQIERA